ncbi:hypothetical protein AVEN_364-1 [Araneus ventricosus]|uniref:Uncharacterized protein n=1 Tax=Araneus ventricosus TaxID=182803 RepID=A0A4Y2DS36_ARAVE|nr:hypothetical protein AVEN_364-1 [Araneus ventricosus]
MYNVFPDIYHESSEILSSETGDETESSSTSFSDDPTSTDSDVSNEPKTSLKDRFENFNTTNKEPDEAKGFWPYLPYTIFAVVVLGLMYVVKMFLEFMKFCVKFYQKLPNFSSKPIQTSGYPIVPSKEIQKNI